MTSITPALRGDVVIGVDQRSEVGDLGGVGPRVVHCDALRILATTVREGST